MTFKIVLMFALGALTALAAKPPACTKYPATVWVATGSSYGITGDGTITETIDGINYTKYMDGQGGVEAYVNGGSCAGTFFFTLTGARKLNLVFQDKLNDGKFGPPSGTPPATTPAWQTYLRGFSFPFAAGPYTTMLIVNFSAPNKQWPGGGVRYEPMTSDFNSDNPDFPLYPNTNLPCETSAAEMTPVGLNTTIVAPVARTCDAYTGPIASLLQQKKSPTLVNVGQYGMDFRFIIEVNGDWVRPQ